MKKNHWIIIGIIMFLAFIFAVRYRNSLYYIDSWHTKKMNSSLDLSAEILTKGRVDVESQQMVKIGLGSGGVYDNVIFKIIAKDFEITNSQGELYSGEYSVCYNDFKSEKYIPNAENGSIISMNYFETYQFKYIGSDVINSGIIYFDIHSLQKDELEENSKMILGLEGNVIKIYYTIRNGKMKFTAK